MIDSLSRHPKLKFVPCGHEQGAAFAADAYARVTRKVGVALSTSGPGAVNLLSGACSAYFDGIPVLFLTGQVASGQLKSPLVALRQLGFQETPVVGVFSHVTKVAWTVRHAYLVPDLLSDAWHYARQHRRGPVLLDLPDDIQRADINPENEHLEPEDKIQPVDNLNDLLSCTAAAERPLVILGAGVWHSHTVDMARAFVEALGWPVLLSWGGMDLLPWDHPQNMGGFGTCGPLTGNLALLNADFVLALGTRLNPQMVPDPSILKGKLAIVDIDANELVRFADAVTIHAHLRDFFLVMADMKLPKWDFSAWLAQIQAWRQLRPITGAKDWDPNPYAFLRALSDASEETDIVLTDAGATLAWVMQTWHKKGVQRIISSWNHSPMGWALPASMGAAFAGLGRRVICVTGDGSFNMNAQELGVLAKHNLWLKVFVMDNQGYGIIRQTQDMWLERRHFASTKEELGLPDIEALALAYGVPALILTGPDDWKLLPELYLWRKSGPAIFRVLIDPKARIDHKTGRSKDLDKVEICASA